jgi:hypothetical protein
LSGRSRCFAWRCCRSNPLYLIVLQLLPPLPPSPLRNNLRRIISTASAASPKARSAGASPMAKGSALKRVASVEQSSYEVGNPNWLSLFDSPHLQQVRANAVMDTGGIAWCRMSHTCPSPFHSQQVIANYLSNAIKFSVSGSPVVVSGTVVDQQRHALPVVATRLAIGGSTLSAGNSFDSNAYHIDSSWCCWPAVASHDTSGEARKYIDLSSSDVHGASASSSRSSTGLLSRQMQPSSNPANPQQSVAQDSAEVSQTAQPLLPAQSTLPRMLTERPPPPIRSLSPLAALASASTATATQKPSSDSASNSGDRYARPGQDTGAGVAASVASSPLAYAVQVSLRF